MFVSTTVSDAASFIKKSLCQLVKLFPKTRVRYEYDVAAQVHSVEVLPNELYVSDKDYIVWENELSSRFIELFPDQNLCFTSEDALVGIREVQFELKGASFSVLSGDFVELCLENTECSFISNDTAYIQNIRLEGVASLTLTDNDLKKAA